MTNDTKHTPEPWTVDQVEHDDYHEGEYQIWHNKSGVSVELAGRIMEKANAQLMAAAPELLEACKMMEKVADELFAEVDHKRVPDWGIINDGLIQNKAAIAKAEGDKKV